MLLVPKPPPAVFRVLVRPGQPLIDDTTANSCVGGLKGKSSMSMVDALLKDQKMLMTIPSSGQPSACGRFQIPASWPERLLPVRQVV
jgi:hypothetical protein